MSWECVKKSTYTITLNFKVQTCVFRSQSNYLAQSLRQYEQCNVCLLKLF